MKTKMNRHVLIVAVFLGWFSPAWGAIDSVRETPVVRVVRENAEAVVNISTERILLLRGAPFWGGYGSEFDVFFDQFFGFHQPARALKLKSVGSGVIVGRDGLIVTNAHVVNMASNVFVVLHDGTTVKGKVAYENRAEELAVIKIEPSQPLKTAMLGATDDLMIGETVIAIGNPLGLENSVTSGIVSGKNRKFYSPAGGFVSDGLLQTDAPINPGNSGGALLNLEGKLIGINVAVAQDFQGIGFAIPVEKIREALEAYRRNPSPPVAQKRAAPAPSAGAGEEDAERDPFAEMGRMSDQMNRMFRQVFDRGARQGSSGVFRGDLFYDQKIDMSEEAGGYIIKVDIAGLNKDKMKIDLDENAVTISGEYSEEKQERGQGIYAQSRSFGFFLRTIPLPEGAEVQGVKTKIKGDTLIIKLPKKK